MGSGGWRTGGVTPGYTRGRVFVLLPRDRPAPGRETGARWKPPDDVPFNVDRTVPRRYRTALRPADGDVQDDVHRVVVGPPCTSGAGGFQVLEVGGVDVAIDTDADGVG